MNTLNVKISTLTKTDVSGLIEVILVFRGESITPERARLLLSDATQNYLVARDSATGTLLGWCNAVTIHRPRQNELFLFEMDVAPAWRQRGVGRQLMASFFDLAETLGCAEAFVFTHQSNPAAMALYQSTGAKRLQSDDVLFVWDLSVFPSDRAHHKAAEAQPA